MRRLLRAAALLAVPALALPARAGSLDDGRPLNLVTVRPLTWIDSTVELEYERVLTSCASAYLSPRARLGRGLVEGSSGTSARGLGLSGGARFFLCDAPEFLWAALEAGLTRTRATRGSVRAERSQWGGLVLVGVTLLVDRHWVLSVSGGAGLTVGHVSVDEVRTDGRLRRAGTFRLAGGVAF